MNIAVFDEDEAVCREIKQMMFDISRETKIYIRTFVFNNAKKLYDSVAEADKWDLCFLNIGNKITGGIEAANFIRNHRNGQVMQLVFLADNTDRVLEVFHFRPIDFIIKPVEYERIKKAVTDTYNILNVQAYKYSYMYERKINVVPVSEIMYFASNLRKVKVFLNDGKSQDFYGRLDNVEHELCSSCFMRVHQSYFVNGMYIDLANTRYNYVQLTDGTRLPVSQNRRPGVLEILGKRGKA